MIVACLLSSACLLAPASSPAGAGRPLVSLVAAPARLMLAGAGRASVQVTNTGRERVVVDVTRAGLALDLRGRPRIVGRRRRQPALVPWLTFRPRRLTLAPGASAPLLVRSTISAHAGPGDHAALLLMTTRPRRGRAVAVRMRLGVVVVARVPGRIVRRLVPLRLRVRRIRAARALELLVANQGNVTESIRGSCVRVVLVRRARVLARLLPLPRQLLPRTRGIAELRYRGRARGPLVAQVRVSPTGQCGRPMSKRFRIRL